MNDSETLAPSSLILPMTADGRLPLVEMLAKSRGRSISGSGRASFAHIARWSVRCTAPRHPQEGATRSENYACEPQQATQSSGARNKSRGVSSPNRTRGDCCRKDTARQKFGAHGVGEVLVKPTVYCCPEFTLIESWVMKAMPGRSRSSPALLIDSACSYRALDSAPVRTGLGLEKLGSNKMQFRKALIRPTKLMRGRRTCRQDNTAATPLTQQA